MTNFTLYQRACLDASKNTTKLYSTSFSLGIRMLNHRYRDAIYAIYGFVRFADEIVDTFHGFDKEKLLNEFENETFLAIERKISLNPIIQSFQEVVRKYDIDHELIKQFLHSMRMDIDKSDHSRESFDQYVLGSAEVVGLMCLRIFCDGKNALYNELKPAAMRLGAAFQKVNFLRDLKADQESLNRDYFAYWSHGAFDQKVKQMIEEEIEEDFRVAFEEGISKLPRTSRFGVYLAYRYYYKLFLRIRRAAAEEVMKKRIRISNQKKAGILVKSYVRHSLNIL